jgi:hypothetical protein
MARRQLVHGAVGVCVAKVSEAQVMVDAGMENFTIAYPVGGRAKLERLARLVRITRRDSSRREQCPPRGTKSVRASHYQPGLRLSLRRRGVRSHHGDTRTDQASSSTRACPGLRCLNQPTSMPGGPVFCPFPLHESNGRD